MPQQNPVTDEGQSQAQLQEEQVRLRAEVERLRAEQERLKAERKDGGPQADAQRPASPREAPPEERGQEPPPEPERPRGSFIRRHPLGVLIGGILIVAAAIGFWFLWGYWSSYESTDDAQVGAHMDPVSSRINGTVIAVYADDNQHVEAGQLLVKVDPTDYRTALSQTEAALAEAQANVQASAPSVPIAQTTTRTNVATSRSNVLNAQAGVAGARKNYDAAVARLREAEANNTKAQNDLARYGALVQKQEISQQQYDAAVAAAKAAAQTVEANQANVQAAQDQIDQANARLEQARSQAEQATSTAPQQVQMQRATLVQRRAAVEAAQAQLKQATLNLQYTEIFSPATGIVGRRSVEPGARVQPGEQLMTIVHLDNVWVTANFKETQLRRMKAGQRATLHVDATGRDYDGYVESVGAATGAQFSLLPPENATGNFVKVVQRLPVRIRFKNGQDPDRRLRPGMSVEAKVWVQ